MKYKFQICIVLLLFSYTNLMAWGSKGHVIIAEIAKTLIKKSTLDSVNKYLSETSFEQAATWMDDVRSNHQYDYLKAMHYINIEKDKTYVKVDGANIMNALESNWSQLQHRHHSNKSEIKMALLVMFHLLGDLHQPLHVGYGDDKGGNNVHVNFKNKKMNLHHVWDTEVIEQSAISLSSCLEKLNSISKVQKLQIQKINFVDWMSDSRKHLNDVYNFNNNEITELYFLQNKTLVELQLAKAGLRLAAVLEVCFGK